MSQLPMFPLGSVLFPHMPLMLRVFEERYIVMLSRVLQQRPSEFGVVLIERGQEVGGGEKRFSTGTVARIVELETAEGFIGLLAEGVTRIEVTDWLVDDPHPAADVRALPELEWDDDLLVELVAVEELVRAAIVLEAGVGEPRWPADIELSDEPVARAWQLAGIAPLGPLDQVALLRSATLAELIGLTAELTAAASEQWMEPDS